MLFFQNPNRIETGKTRSVKRVHKDLPTAIHQRSARLLYNNIENNSEILLHVQDFL